MEIKSWQFKTTNPDNTNAQKTLKKLKKMISETR